MIYTVATVVGVPNLPLEAYEQALASLRREDLWNPPDDKPLLRFAKQFNADFPVEAAGMMACVLSREDLWDDPDPAPHDDVDAEESSDTHNESGEPESLRERVRREDLREDLRLADAQDYALEALALCGPSAEQVAVELLMGMRRAIEQRLVDRVWDWVYSAGNSPIAAVDAAVLREIGALPSSTRIGQPLIELLAAMKRGVPTAGLPPWQEEYVPKEIDELAARDDEYPLPFGTRFNEYVIHTQGLTILNPDAGIPGSLFVLGLLALAYRETGTVPPDAFWRSGMLICDGGLTRGKRYFFQTLAPSATAALIEQAVRPEDFGNLLYSCRGIPLRIALPHFLHVLRRSDMRDRGYYLGWFKDHYAEWSPRDALEGIVPAIKNLLREVGTQRLSLSDERPVLWELAGAVQVLAGMTLAFTNKAGVDLDLDQSAREALVGDIRSIRTQFEGIWPERMLGADWEAVARAVPGTSLSVESGALGWNPFSSVYRFCGVDHPTTLLQFVSAVLGPTADDEGAQTEHWRHLTPYKLW